MTSGKFSGMVLTNKFLSIKYLVAIFFLLNLFIKFFNIQANPSASTYDEVIYMAEAQSIIKYGTDLKGDWRPWHLEPSDSYYTELTSTVLTPGFILFPNNPVLASKFVPIILGSLIPILLGLIAYRLRKEKGVFIVTTLIATLNPWVFQFSRMSYDSLFSISFYLIGIVIILYLQKWHKLWAVLPLFLGFFQYQGHKPLLVPLIGLCFVYLFIEKYPINKLLSNFKKIIKDKNITASFLILVFSLTLTIAYMIRLPQLTSGERASEFSIFSEAELSSTVNDGRRLSLSSPFNSIFINKYTALTTTLTDRFLNSFNLRRLFIEGDRGVDTFTVLDYGYFHLVDILVLVLSFTFIFANKKDYKIAIFVLPLILIGTLPNIIRTGQPWIIFRGAFTFLSLIIIMGLGFSAFLNLFKKKVSIFLVIVYLLASLPFFFTYFFRYPISHTNNIGLYERVVASYIDRINSNEAIYIIPDRDDATFVYQAHYNQLLTKENQLQIAQSMKDRKYKIDNIFMEGGCTSRVKGLENSTVFVYLTKQPCEFNHDSTKTTQIKSLIDSGTIFTVYNDNLCSKYDLNAYPNIKKNVFAVEKLSDQEFCQNFFSKDN